MQSVTFVLASKQCVTCWLAVETERRAVRVSIHIVLRFVSVAAEIEHISGLFQEKQAELQAAVLRVDQLSQQLEELRKGRLNGLQGLGGHVTGTAALELRKLYQELQVCTYIWIPILKI